MFRERLAIHFHPASCPLHYSSVAVSAGAENACLCTVQDQTLIDEPEITNIILPYEFSLKGHGYIA